MAHQVGWTQSIINNFIREACLSDDEAFIIQTRARGMSIVEQSIKLNKSVQTINRMIKDLKIKYDIVQMENPSMFPKRKTRDN